MEIEHKPSLETIGLATLADQLLTQLKAKPGEPARQLLTEDERKRAEAETRRRDEEALAKQVEARRQRNAAANMSRVPPKLRADIQAASIEGAALAAWPGTASALSWWHGKKTRALLIRGSVGVGKSMAAAAVARVCAEAASGNNGAYALAWLRPEELVSAVLHKYAENAPKLGNELVVIDDVGLENRPEFEHALCELLDDYTPRVVMTTNLTKDAFRERYGLRVIDRLNECGSAITVKGESRRKKSGDF